MLNRSEIMKAAWAGYRAQVADIPGFPFSRKLFAHYLRSSWAEAKARVRDEQRAEAAEEPARVREIKAELLAIEMSDAYRAPHYERARALRAELARLAA